MVSEAFNSSTVRPVAAATTTFAFPVFILLLWQGPRTFLNFTVSRKIPG